MKLRFRLVAPMLGLLILLLSLTSYLSYTSAERDLYKAHETALQRETNVLLQTTQAFIQQCTQETLRLATLDVVKNAFLTSSTLTSTAKMQQVLNQERSYMPNFIRITLLNTKGIALYSSDTQKTTLGEDFSESDYFTAALAGKAYFSSMFMSPLDGIPVMVTAAPVKKDSTTIGVIRTTVKLDSLYAMTQVLRRGDTGTAFLLNAQGLVAVSSQKAHLFNEDLQEYATYATWVTQKGEGHVEVLGQDNEPFYTYYNSDPALKVVAVSSIQSQELFADIHALRTASILRTLGSIIFGALILGVLVLPILRNVEQGRTLVLKLSRALATSTTQLSRYMQHIVVGSRKQKDSAHTINRHMSQMHHSLQFNAQSMENACNKNSEHKGKAAHGVKMVQRVTEAMEEVNALSLTLGRGAKTLDSQVRASKYIVRSLNAVTHQSQSLAQSLAQSLPQSRKQNSSPHASTTSASNAMGYNTHLLSQRAQKLAEKSMQSTADMNNCVLDIQNYAFENVTLCDKTTKSLQRATELAEASSLTMSEIQRFAESNDAFIQQKAQESAHTLTHSEQLQHATKYAEENAGKLSLSIQKASKTLQSISQLAVALQKKLHKL